MDPMLIDAEIELFQRLLFCGAFAVDADARIRIGLLLALLLCFSIYGLSNQTLPANHPGNAPQASPTVISTPNTVPDSQQTPEPQKHHHKKGDGTPSPNKNDNQGD